jgi:para-aminobenzoate synthetase/4-amino-4-deoxychorismate lyase
MKVILKHAGKWLHFQDPEKVLRAKSVDEVLPMLREAEASGLFVAGFVSYEAAPAFDAALKVHASDGFPLLCLGLFRAPEVLDEVEVESSASYQLGELKPSVSKADFVAAIGEIKERIAEGATYQVNYTYRLKATFSGDAWTFFHALVKDQKADYAAFVDVGDWAICSASPELFFSLKEGQILTRPMKGTARRGRTFSEDWKAAEALRESEKDRAENIMIVDMIHNDVGRIARSGSVETLRQYEVEKYPTVWQMTSTVRGQIEPQVNADKHGLFESVFKALFPGASITGAPTAKTMEIIQGLEAEPRRVYTGAIGFFTPQSEACFNVAIRTALIDRSAGRLEFGVGGGIVWDSDAEAEYEETLTKARVLTQPRPVFQLLETMLWEPDAGIFLLDEHLQRLGKSAAYFDVPLDQYEIFQALEALPQSLPKEKTRIRLLVDRDGAFELQTASLIDAEDRPVMLALAKYPIHSQDIFMFHKTTHRGVYEKAQADFPQCDDVVLWNERGEVTESTIANLVIRKEGRLITPPVGCGLLAGTFREQLLKAGEIEEEILSVADLEVAEEIFLINSVRRWRRVVFASNPEA